MESVLFPDIPLVVPPHEERFAVILAFPLSLPFKIVGTRAVEGVDYSALTCPGMFLGSMNFPADTPWPISLMIGRGFTWPGGGLSEHGSNIPFPGQVDFHFRVRNESDTEQRFQIELLVETLR